jgi:hypothetical protein
MKFSYKNVLVSTYTWIVTFLIIQPVKEQTMSHTEDPQSKLPSGMFSFFLTIICTICTNYFSLRWRPTKEKKPSLPLIKDPQSESSSSMFSFSDPNVFSVFW